MDAVSGALKRQKLSQDEVVALFREISNWDKWGRDDERGTLNYITPEKVRSATATVRSGRVVSMGHDIVTVAPGEPSPQIGLRPATLQVITPTPPETVNDEVTLPDHNWANTHLDALTHVSYGGHYWNGKPLTEAVTADGIQFGSIYVQREGIVTRGVLLNVAKARGIASVSRDDIITIEDLDAAERISGTTVTRGDAVIVAGMRQPIVTEEHLKVRPGLAPECARWLHEREVALLGTDCPERLPSGYDSSILRVAFHQVVLVQMGLILLDNVNCEPLVRAAEEEGRSEFLFTVAPLRIKKSSGSLVNPLAVF